MRNDLKIGMLVVASIVIVVAVYFAVTGRGDKDNETPTADAPPPTFRRLVDEDRADVGDDFLSLDDILDSEDELVPLEDEEDILGVGEIGDRGAAEEDLVRDDAEDDIFIYDDDPVGGVTFDDDEDEEVLPVPAGAMREYVVKGTETGGFWSVSEEVYGHGKYWKLIEDANPTVNSRALNKGTVLKIPPLPTRAATVEHTGPALSAGTTADRRTYIVQADDSAGFWGISKKVYNGEGKYHTLIQEANPDVDSRTLRKGTKLVIPPLPVTGATPASGTATSGTTSRIDLPTGATTHTVVGGDSLWEIAKAYYGNGAFHYLIIEANPGVTTTSTLQLGQVLIIPAKPASDTVPAGSGTSGRGGSGATRDPERPYFE